MKYKYRNQESLIRKSPVSCYTPSGASGEGWGEKRGLGKGGYSDGWMYVNGATSLGMGRRGGGLAGKAPFLAEDHGGMCSTETAYKPYQIGMGSRRVSILCGPVSFPIPIPTYAETRFGIIYGTHVGMNIVK